MKLQQRAECRGCIGVLSGIQTSAIKKCSFFYMNLKLKKKTKFTGDQGEQRARGEIMTHNRKCEMEHVLLRSTLLKSYEINIQHVM